MDNDIRSQSLVERMTDSWYNLRYFLTTYFNSSDNQLKQKETLEINKENIEFQIEKLKSIIKRTIWMTYRKNFPPLLNSNYISDTGWGCMIRAGQMAIAQVIKKHLKNYDDERSHFLGNITQGFIDNDENEHCNFTYQYMYQKGFIEKYLDKENKGQNFLYPFSIQKIVVLGFKNFSLNPGEWYKPNYILFILETLHNSFPLRGSDFKLVNYLGSETLKLQIFNDSSIFLDQIVKKMFGLELECKKKHKSRYPKLEESKVNTTQSWIQSDDLICQKCLDEVPEEQRYSIGVFILTRIGLDEPNPDYLKVIDSIMAMRSFQGIVGGSPQRALYILGRIDQQYIYLDPHYVQEGTTKQMNILNDETFTCSNLHLLPQSSVDTSMALSFYIRDYKELVQFWEELSMVKEKHNNNFFIFKNDETPDFMDSSTSKIIAADYEDDDVIIVE